MLDSNENVLSYFGLVAMFVAFVLGRPLRIPEYARMFIVSAGMTGGAIGRLIFLWDHPNALPVTLFLYVLIALVFLTWGFEELKKRRPRIVAVSDRDVVPNQSAGWANPPALDDDRFRHG